MADATADVKLEAPFPDYDHDMDGLDCGADIKTFDASINKEKQEPAEGVAFVPIIFEEETTSFPPKRPAAEIYEDMPPKKKPARPSSTKTSFVQEMRAFEPSVANVELEVERPQYEKGKTLEHGSESPNTNTQDRTGQRHIPPEVAQANEGPNLGSAKATPRLPNPKRTTVNQTYVKPKRAPAASKADETLVSMKESGYSWNEIREKWTELTGQVTASSTLPNRYKRLQVIMMELRDTEKDILVAAKEAVEANWKTMMWSTISIKMEAMGARKFPPEFLCKEFKRIEKKEDEIEAAR
ncbi:MAG: hypothetical protein L6R42_003934, partial [Xanthoria sp. 1 TBL-2021]